MAALRALLRWFSFLYHAVLTLFLLGIALAAWSSGQELHLPMLPWSGSALTHWLLAGSLLGLASLILALRRIWPALFFLWSLVVLVVMVRGYFLGPYYFHGRPQFNQALYLTLGALLAAVGAWFHTSGSRRI